MTTPKETAKHSRGCRENLAKFFYDLAKLAFAAMTVTGSINLIAATGDTQQNVAIFGTGIVATAVFAVLGYKINSIY